MFYYFVILFCVPVFNMVSLVSCEIRLYQFLIIAILPFLLHYPSKVSKTSTRQLKLILYYTRHNIIACDTKELIEPSKKISYISGLKSQIFLS